jgi:uncharacterized protein VirK/YbjX
MFRTILRTALAEHPGYTPRAIHRKVRLFFRALLNSRALEQFAVRIGALNSRHENPLSSRTIGLVEWPYIHKAWSASKRLDAVATHYEILEGMDSVLMAIEADTSFPLVNLEQVCSGLNVVIDRAPWFQREGELVLNLFLADLRVASLAFAVGRGPSKSVQLLIGAIQGIHSGIPHETSLSIYRDLTKQLHGLRPKPLLVDILRMMARHLDAKQILAIADENRQHRHAYFGERDKETFASDYDQIWEELGGHLDTVSGFFDIPVAFGSRDLADVPSKKRAMYRRRYETLEFINGCVASALGRQSEDVSREAVQ